MSQSESGESFLRWQPSELMEWAKSNHADGKYTLARSGVPPISDLSLLPGGPFTPAIWGHNEWGHEGLKETVAALYGLRSENVLLAQGASQCNYLIAGAVLAGGGTAIVETPVYQPILRAVQVWADRVLRLPRRRENRSQPDPDELRKLITGDTRLVALTNLHNPTHVALGPERLDAIVTEAGRVGATVTVDEVFLPMIERDHHRHAVSHGAISISSLGKAWGLDALRVGWAAGDARIIHRAYRLNNLIGVNQPFMTEDLAWRILQSADAVRHMVSAAERAAQGRDLFEAFLTDTPQVRCFPRDGGISALIELPPGTDDRAFAEALFKQQDTVVFPGSLFEAPGTLRISFGEARDKTTEGLKRLRSMVQQWR